MAKSSKLILLMIFCIPFAAWSQINRYVVFFENKEGSEFDISSPEAFLSERAISRRMQQSIDITVQDLPVTKQNLDILRNEDLTPIFTSRWLNAALVEATQTQLEALVDADAIEGYELAAPGQKLSESPDAYELTYTANVPADVQSNSADQLDMMGADDMHMDGFNGEGISVAVFDAGFELVNESSLFAHIFDGNLLNDYHDFTINERDVFTHDLHGTNALSCIAANYQNVMVGTGFGATFSLFVTEDVSTEYRIEEYNWLFAAERADSAGVDIISSSVGYYNFDDPTMDYDYEETNGETSIVSKAAKYATDRGILVVNSVGNEGRNNDWPYMVLPADVEGLLAVGATDANGNRVSFSSIGPTTDGRIKPDVATLGFNVAVFGQSNTVTVRSGTSFSAPLVTGLAAGLWQKYPELTNMELKSLILASSNQANQPDTLLGYGVPNYNLAIAEPVLSLTNVIEEELSVFPNPFSGDHISVTLDLSGSKQTVEFVVLAPEGKVISRKRIARPRKGRTYIIDVPGNSQGVYILQVNRGGTVKNIKILRY